MLNKNWFTSAQQKKYDIFLATDNVSVFWKFLQPCHKLLKTPCGPSSFVWECILWRFLFLLLKFLWGVQQHLHFKIIWGVTWNFKDKKLNFLHILTSLFMRFLLLWWNSESFQKQLNFWMRIRSIASPQNHFFDNFVLAKVFFFHSKKVKFCYLGNFDCTKKRMMYNIHEIHHPLGTVDACMNVVVN